MGSITRPRPTGDSRTNPAPVGTPGETKAVAPGPPCRALAHDPDDFAFRSVAEAPMAEVRVCVAEREERGEDSGLMPLVGTARTACGSATPPAPSRASLASDIAAYLPSRQAWIELRPVRHHPAPGHRLVRARGFGSRRSSRPSPGSSLTVPAAVPTRALAVKASGTANPSPLSSRCRSPFLARASAAVSAACVGARLSLDNWRGSCRVEEGAAVLALVRADSHGAGRVGC